MTDITSAIKDALTATVSCWRDTDLEDYTQLERGRPGNLDLLLEPATEAELVGLVGALREHGIQTTTIAGQSGLVEAQRPHGVAISMRRFDHIGEITLPDGVQVPLDRIAGLAARPPAELRGARLRVGAGVAIDTINEALAPGGLKLPIVMGSSGSATAGACAANGSAGANAIRYGTAADMARHVRGVLGTGEIVAQDVTPRRQRQDPDHCAIRADRFSHGDALVGSQGAFGIITEVTYEVVPMARDQATALLPVPDVATATHVLEQLSARYDRPGVGLELFEIIARDTLGHALDHAEQSLRDGVADAPYYAMALVVSDVATGPSMFGSAFVEELVTFMMSAVVGPDDVPLYPGGDFDFDHDPSRLLHLREACSEMSRLLPKQAYDIVVPVARLDRFVARLAAEIAAKHPEFRLSIFGHAGVGALHLHAIAKDQDLVDRSREDLDRLVFDLVQELGGSPWAEHGVGSKWAGEWRRRTPTEVQREMVAIKRRHDPDNVIGSRLFGFETMLAG